jgi:hypothetical protein
VRNEARQRDIGKPRGIAGLRRAREQSLICRTRCDRHAHCVHLSSGVDDPWRTIAADTCHVKQFACGHWLRHEGSEYALPPRDLSGARSPRRR